MIIIWQRQQYIRYIEEEDDDDDDNIAVRISVSVVVVVNVIFSQFFFSSCKIKNSWSLI